jgi:hypothetical protein
MARQEARKNSYAATFVPKLRTSQEKIWITILRRPEFIGKSTDELLQVFEPRFICKDRNLNVLKKDQNEIVFEEQDSTCYGQTFRYTMGRIARGHNTVAYYAYRADVPAIPNDRRDFVMKTITTAPLDTTGAPPVAAPSAPAASPAAAGTS